MNFRITTQEHSSRHGGPKCGKISSSPSRTSWIIQLPFCIIIYFVFLSVKFIIDALRFLIAHCQVQNLFRQINIYPQHFDLTHSLIHYYTHYLIVWSLYVFNLYLCPSFLRQQFLLYQTQIPFIFTLPFSSHKTSASDISHIHFYFSSAFHSAPLFKYHFFQSLNHSILYAYACPRKTVSGPALFILVFQTPLGTPHLHIQEIIQIVFFTHFHTYLAKFPLPSLWLFAAHKLVH